MAHAHHHGHSHSHSHAPAPAAVNKAFIIGAVLNTAYVVVEFGIGFYYNSLALLADAGHNLSDVASLLLALLAFRLGRVHQRPGYTYGYRKSTVLVSLLNALLLLLAVGAIVWESIQRFRHPEPIAGDAVAVAAGVGIVINSLSALLFFRDKEHDLNIKGAYLHLLVDALVSAGVVVSGLAIRSTGWYWLDPLMGIVVAIIIIGSTWRLLADSVRLSLDGVPLNVDVEKITTEIRKVGGIRDVHHIHVWAMSTTENALTAHLVLQPGLDEPQIVALKHTIRHELEHLGIGHATLETELSAADCEEEEC